MTRKILSMVFIMGLIMALGGCGNIFDALYPDKSTGSTNVSDLVAMGDSALQNGQIDQALSYYGQAIAKNSTSSKARLGYAKAYILKKNVDLIWLASKFVGKKTEDMSSTISTIASSMTNTMNVVIEKLDPISKGNCDGAIAANDFEVNLNLALAYFIRAFLRNGDSNGDGNFFSSQPPGNGDMFVFQNNNITYNTDVVAFANMQGPLNSLLSDLQGFSNKGALPRSSMSNVLMLSHNIVEDILFVYRIFGSSFSDFTGATSALNQAVNGLSVGTVIDDIKTEVNSRVDDMKKYFDGATADADNLSSDHLSVVGVQMSNWNGGTSDWFNNFAKSSWNIHLQSIPDTTYASGKTNLLKRFSTKTGNYTNTSLYDLNYIKDVVDVVNTILNHVQNANLLKSLGAGGS